MFLCDQGDPQEDQREGQEGRMEDQQERRIRRHLMLMMTKEGEEVLVVGCLLQGRKRRFCCGGQGDGGQRIRVLEKGKLRKKQGRLLL